MLLLPTLNTELKLGPYLKSESFFFRTLISKYEYNATCRLDPCAGAILGSHSERWIHIADAGEYQYLAD
jgi:hypothetical protein